MTRRITISTLAAALLAACLGAASCIRDEIPPCPPLRIMLAVQDKNYFNVDDVDLEDRLPENLPFRRYIPTLYYVLRNADTDEVVLEQDIYKVASDDEILDLTFPDDLPFGRYIVTIWGGLATTDPLGDDPLTIDFHPDGIEGHDVYITTDTLSYDYLHSDYLLEMQRAKGKLIVEVENLPDGIEYGSKMVSGLYSFLDADYNFYGITDVTTTSRWSGSYVVRKTMLTPSIDEGSSILTIEFYSSPDQTRPQIITIPVRITMFRNTLTVIRFVYDEGFGFLVYALVNDNWELIHYFDIE